MNNSDTYNPYSKNLEAMQGFFKKPLILFTAIACCLYALANPAFLLTDIFAGNTSYIMEKLVFSCIVFSVLVLPAVSYFIIYSRLKSFFKASCVLNYIYSIAGLIALIGFAWILICSVEAKISAVLILILPFFIAIIYLIANILVFHSIKRSMTSIYLKSNGSILLAVISFFGVIFGIALFFAALASIFKIFANSDFLIAGFGVKLSDICFSNDLSIYLLVIGLILFIRSLLIASFSISYYRYVCRLKSTVNISPMPAPKSYVQPKMQTEQKEEQSMETLTKDINFYYFNIPASANSLEENPYTAKRSKKHNKHNNNSVQNSMTKPNLEFTPHNPFDKDGLQ